MVWLAGSVVGIGSAAALDGQACSDDVDLSANGRFMVFDYSTALVPADRNDTCDVYLMDTTSGSFALISRAEAGGAGNGSSLNPSISNNGRYVAFESAATNLVGGDGNGQVDVLVRDRTTGKTVLISGKSSGIPGNAGSFDAEVSGNGAFVAFETDATNLVGETGGNRQIAVWKRANGALVRASTAAGQPVAGHNEDASVDDDGSRVAFRTDAAAFAAPGFHAAVLRDLTASTTTVIRPTCRLPHVGSCVADIKAGPELDGAGNRAAIGFREATSPGFDEVGAMVRVSNNIELFAVTDLFQASEVAISRDGRVLTASDSQGDFLEFVGDRGEECIDDPDLFSDVALSDNGGEVAYMQFDTDPLVLKLTYDDGVCIER